jgi:uncharacterized protein
MAACELKIRVIPRASRAEVRGERGDAITIKLAAAPVKGAANRALLEFLSKRLDLPKSALNIVGGETSRDKRLHIEGLDEAAARARLLGTRPLDFSKE